MKSVGVSENRYNSQLQKSRSNDWPNYFDRSPPLKTISCGFLRVGNTIQKKGLAILQIGILVGQMSMFILFQLQLI